MTITGEIRWGIVGTANIARGQFLPGLREAGGGRPAMVAGRDPARARAWAAENGVDLGVGGYDTVTDSPDIDAVYVAVPNSLHAEWTVRALRAGKAVLSEKPLCVGPAQTAEVLEAAREIDGALLWEAFVFPFQDQHRRLTQLLEDGAIGQPAEIISVFHFRPTRPGDIRFSAALGGGALADVGCYPIRLAHEQRGAAARDQPVPPRPGRHADRAPAPAGAGHGEPDHRRALVHRRAAAHPRRAARRGRARAPGSGLRAGHRAHAGGRAGGVRAVTDGPFTIVINAVRTRDRAVTAEAIREHYLDSSTFIDHDGDHDHD